jgi:hypothetical protein
VGIIVARYRVLGDEVKRPGGPGTWKVTMAVQGTGLGQARVTTATPLDLDRQHVLDEHFQSEQMTYKPADVRRPERRQVYWSQQKGAPNGAFRLHCEYHVAIDVTHPNYSMARLAAGLYGPPGAGEHLDVAELAGKDRAAIAEQARRLTADQENATKTDEAESLYHFVDREVHNDPSSYGPAMTAGECLKEMRGDSAAKSRLLAALLRCREIPARIVHGVTLTKGPEQRAHYWVEAWSTNRSRWLPLCPFHHHFGRVPATYLVFGFGDQAPVRGRQVKDLDYAFLVEHAPTEEGSAEESTWHHIFTATSLRMLPLAEQRLVEILLLLPVAALIICVFRNLIGLSSFGTFAPALIGLAFHELPSLPGILVFVAILLVGWVMRRVLDYYHLLQVPRVAVMLTLIMCVLIAVIVVSNRYGASTTLYISLFPLVILTGMVERFWTLETEDSTAASFKTLLHTMIIATVIALVLSLRALVLHLFRYPETLGLIVAAQLLIGRYTGFRLMELYRFRDFVRQPGAAA